MTWPATNPTIKNYMYFLFKIKNICNLLKIRLYFTLLFLTQQQVSIMSYAFLSLSHHPIIIITIYYSTSAIILTWLVTKLWSHLRSVAWLYFTPQANPTIFLVTIHSCHLTNSHHCHSTKKKTLLYNQLICYIVERLNYFTLSSSSSLH